jgi:hypothetical protein
MDKIKVLWMNNGDEDLLIFAESANSYNLSIITCNNMQECKNKLSDYSNRNWDAVILNAEPRLMEGDIPQSKSLSTAYLQIVRLSPYIPIFIASANAKLNIWDKREARNLSQGRFYDLQKSSNQLFEDIKAEIESNEDYKIRKRYETIFRFYASIEGAGNDILLLKLLKSFQNDDFYKDPLVPSNVRLILDNVMSWLTNAGVLKETPFTGSNLRECSIELGKKGKVVPYHVQRCFHSCVDIANNGNHKIPEESVFDYGKRTDNPLYVQKQITNGVAPYLNKTLVYDLLNILYWCATLKN